MTRIAYLTSEYPAKSHTFIRREIEALRKRGLTIIPFSVRASSDDAGERVAAILARPRAYCISRAIGALVRSPRRAFSTWLLAQSHRAAGLRGLAWSQFHFVEALAFSQMLQRSGADRLHCHFANSGATVGMLAAHFLRMPWSLTLHGISETDPPSGQLLAEKLDRAEFAACASWFIRAQAMRLSPAELWSKLLIVRCGVEVPTLPERTSRGNGSAVRMLSIGRLSPEKGFPGLMEAVEKALAQGLDAQLTLIGDGPLRGMLEKRANRANLRGRIAFKGALSERETLSEIASCDVLVVSSLMEGLPVVLIEALALAKPVIAPNVAGIPELISDGETGLLFRPGDWDHLAEQIQLLASNRDQWQKMGAAGRARVEMEFDVEVAVEPLRRLFQ